MSNCVGSRCHSCRRSARVSAARPNATSCSCGSTSPTPTAERRHDRGLGRVRGAVGAELLARVRRRRAARDHPPPAPPADGRRADRSSRRRTGSGQAPRPPDGQGSARDGGARRRAPRDGHHVPPSSEATGPGCRAVSAWAFPTIDELLAEVQAYVDDGYARIKLKIEPGWDIEPVRLVRELIGPESPSRSTPTRRTAAATSTTLPARRVRPAADRAAAARGRHDRPCTARRRVDTPVCLDESIVSAAGTADAIEMGASEIVNIKPGRVGGYLEAVRIHDLCLARGVPVWCGGMLETGIGRAANAALAALPGFTLPGDISASTRFYARDIVTDPITIADGHVACRPHRASGSNSTATTSTRSRRAACTSTGAVQSPNYDVSVPVRRVDGRSSRDP